MALNAPYIQYQERQSDEKIIDETHGDKNCLVG